MTTDLQSAESHSILPVERLGDTLLVVPHGDLGGYSPHAFQGEFQRVLKLLADPTLKNLIIDLSGSRYFGSEMVGALVAMRERVIERGRAVLTNVSTDTRTGLDIIKADTLFEFMDTRSEAINKLATLTVGERIQRHRRPLRWITTLLVLALVSWGAYESRVVYRVFGSRTARCYSELAKQWERFQADRERWTAEEARTYKSELLDQLASLNQRLERGGWFPVPEDYWLKHAIQAWQSNLESNETGQSDLFLRYMRYARFYIVERTGLDVPKLGSGDAIEGEIPPPPPPLENTQGESHESGPGSEASADEVPGGDSPPQPAPASAEEESGSSDPPEAAPPAADTVNDAA